MTAPTFSTIYEHHQGPEISDFGPSLTKQEFLEESDVNFIVNQYETTGLGPLAADREPIYGDFTDPALTDYHHALQVVAGAAELFQRLPARVRERFANDPANLIQFVQDPNNQKEAHELGLLRDDYQSPSAPPLPMQDVPGGAATTPVVKP